MLKKLNSSIEFYANKLNRKERQLNQYAERIAKGEELNPLESERRNILIAEISLIKSFLEEMEHITADNI